MPGTNLQVVPINNEIPNEQTNVMCIVQDETAVDWKATKFHINLPRSATLHDLYAATGKEFCYEDSSFLLVWKRTATAENSEEVELKNDLENMTLEDIGLPPEKKKQRFYLRQKDGCGPVSTKRCVQEKKMEACFDGTSSGWPYFMCPPKPGLSVHRRNCQPDSRFKSGNQMASKDRWLTGIETSRSSEVETPLMEARERKSGSGFTPDGNEEVAGLELDEKNVATGETAMSAGPVAEIGRLLTCSICLEMLTDSRTLGCHHSFCKCCLERYVKRQREEASAKPTQRIFRKGVEEFQCPDCRASFCLKQGQGVEAIPRSHLVNSILEVVQRSVKEIPSNPRENQEKVKVGKAYCKIHEKKKLKFYCENCEEMICSYCMAFNHGKGNHSCFPAEDVAEKEREAIKQCSNSLEKNLNEANEALQEISSVTQLLRNHAEQAKEEIIRQKDDVLATLTHKLEQKAELMMNVVDEKHNEACQPLEIQRSEIEEYIKMLSDSVDLSKNLVDKGTTEEILSSKKMFRENMEKAKNGRPRRMKPVHDGIMEFEIGTLNLESIVDDLEKIGLTMEIPKKASLWCEDEERIE